MFRKGLSERLKRIFDVPKVSLNKPGDEHEQDCLFVDIETARSQIKDGLEVSQVSGKLTLYGPAADIPFGYFAKKLDAASADDSSKFFFHDFEGNKWVFENIVERTVSFVYLYSGQYDPEHGEINELNTNIQEN